MICDSDDKCVSLLNDPPACLKTLVHIKRVSNTTMELAKRKGIEMISLERVEKIGASSPQKEFVSRPARRCRRAPLDCFP